MNQGYHGHGSIRKFMPLAVGGLSGLIGSLAYPTPGWWPLAWVMYVPILGWIERSVPSRAAAFAAGWVSGFVLHVAVFSFLADTMREMSGLPPAAGWGVVLLHAAVMALHQGLWAGAVAWTRPVRLSGPWNVALRAGAVASLFMAAEFALPWMFRWYLGNAFYRAPLWIQAADVVGVIGVSGLCVALSWLLAAALALPDQRKRALAGAAAVMAAWGGYGLLRQAQVGQAQTGRHFSALVVQHNATLDEKRSGDSKTRTRMLDRLEEMTRGAQRTGQLSDVQAVVWAEGAFPFQWGPEDPRPAMAKQTARSGQAGMLAKARVWKLSEDLRIPLLLGSLRRVDPQGRQPVRNAAVIMDQGVQRWSYDKKILLAFGEYLPGSTWFPQLKGAIRGISDFDRGTTAGLVSVAGVPLLVNICYEALFADFMRQEAGESAQVLLNLTNDVWFGNGRAPELHLMVQSARAIELRRPMLRATVTGISAMIEANGQIRGETATFQPAMLKAALPLVEMGSPYRWWGDGPLWLLSVGVIAALFRQMLMDKRARAWPNTQPSGEGDL
jgi:apolipoprotein N-acyltransferase